MNQEADLQIVKDDEIDLMALILTIWRGRILIFKTIGVFILLGLFIAIFSPEEYSTTVKLIPESGQSMSLGSLSGLASQFGFGSLSAASADGETIPPDYYPAIIGSIPFMKQVMDAEVYIPEAGRTMTIFSYFSEYRKKSVVSVVKKYTIGLPFTILAAIKGDKPELTGDDGMTVYSLTKDEWKVYELLQELIGVDIDKETGIVSVSLTMPEGQMVAQVGDLVTSLLSGYVLDYKTEKARNDLQFIEEQLVESEARFEQTQVALAKFRDANHGQKTEMALTNEQRLQSDYDLAFKIYSAMAQKRDEARIKLQEKTPVVKVLEPAVVPKEKSAPRRSVIMVMSIFLGGFVGLGILFGRMIWTNFNVKFKEMNNA
ncbi:GNVR domain-containing protein [Geofilum sp. OHC36d9]|uniref:GNVR domain-containing protein n=1 Tax=Geofilum sp. OHC36d9 TaxID=3458413 RepID=UPI0040343ED8